MKILWLCNIVIPGFETKTGSEASLTGGWLVDFFYRLSNNPEFQLSVCFPNQNACSGNNQGINYYAFCRSNVFSYSKAIENYFFDVLEKEKPDLIHIWGTEFPHALAMINACEHVGLLDKTVISIQGIISLYGNQTDHYFAGLSSRVIRKHTIRDLLRNDNVWMQREKFSVRGEFEIQALKKAKHVIGRTDWDFAAVIRINPELNYHKCNESLRECFYSDSWSYDMCEKHSVFVSQCSYPLKGFHKALEALNIVKNKYPDVHLYTTGQDIMNKSFLSYQRGTYYQLYLAKLIKCYHLQKNITFCGALNGEQMKERLLKANLFVLPSSVENSSNSLGEAMLLGVPCVASDVGGTRSMLSSGIEGYLYPFNETYLLDRYIDEIFSNRELAEMFSQNSRNKARQRHDQKHNYQQLLSIYNDIMHTN